MSNNHPRLVMTPPRKSLHKQGDTQQQCDKQQQVREKRRGPIEGGSGGGARVAMCFGDRCTKERRRPNFASRGMRITPALER